MRRWLAAAVLLCLSAPAAWAGDTAWPWPETAPVPPAPAAIKDHILAEDRVVKVLSGARDEALGLLSKRAAVRLDDATYARLSGRTDALPWGLRPYLVRAEDRDDGWGSLGAYAWGGHVLVEYSGPTDPANCRRVALILLLPSLPKMHMSMNLYF